MAVSNLTASPIVLGTQGDADSRSFFVTWVRWNGATTAGHALVLRDTAGNLVFASEADGANFIDIQPIFKVVKGLSLATMQSGTCYVFYR